MIEFFAGKPAFNGQDEISQLETIYKIMGTPTVESWPDITQLPWYDLIKPKAQYKSRFRELYGRYATDIWRNARYRLVIDWVYVSSLLSPGALELLEAMLSMDPKKRPTAAEALEFDYFTKEEPAAVPPAK